MTKLLGKRGRGFGKRGGAGLLLVMLMASFAVNAQDDSAAEQATAIDKLEPGVDTTGLVEDAAPAARNGDTAEPVDPAVPSAVLSGDVSRDQSGGRVMDRMELGRTEITGNQELPKVLYIVPWKKADPGDLMGKPVNTLLDDVLAPLDREEFVRSVEFYDELNGVDGE